MRRLFLLLLLACAGGAGAWIYFGGNKPKPAAQSPLRIYFTCDTRGRIEPCGCFTGQMGGLTRVASVMKTAPPHALKFEIGDAIAGNEDFHVLQYRHLLAAFADVGYSAVNLGRREAGLSATELREVAAKSPVPLLSSNVVDAQTSDPIVRPWLVVNAGNLRVGVLGVVDPARLNRTAGEGVAVLGMAESLRKFLPEVRANADVLVCLAFTDEAGMESLAREFYEIPLILGGDVRQPSPAISKINQSHLLATTNEGRALAAVRAVFDPATPGLQNITGDIRLMETLIPQDAAIAAHADAYRHEVRSADLKTDHPERNTADLVPGVTASATYVGSAVCAGCHAESSAAWKKSRHAHAFKSLVTRDSDADPSCIACHVTGFGETSGHQRLSKDTQFVNVGCESCHGPASEHVAERTRNPGNAEVLVRMRPVGAGQCIQCHHGEFSRPFKFEDSWPRIIHGKEKKP